MIAEDSHHVNMKVKPFKWITYLKPYFLKDIVDTVRGAQLGADSGLLCFINGVYEEFGIGSKTNRQKAFSSYTIGVKEHMDPFCAFRLAEIYSDPCHMADIVQSDFALSWQHLLLSVSLSQSSYGFLIPQSIEAMRKLMTYADPDLTNSLDQLHTMLANANVENSDQCARLLHSLLRLHLVNDKLMELQLFNSCLTILCSSLEDKNQLNYQFAWETLFQLNLTQTLCENSMLRHCVRVLSDRKAMQLVYLRKVSSLCQLLFLKLPQDHELYKHVRYQIFELHLLRQHSARQGEIDDTIDQLMLNIFKQMLSTTVPRLSEVTEKIQIIRGYADIQLATSQNKNDAINTLRLEFSYQLEETYYAYTHYRIAQLQMKMNFDKATILDELKVSERLFLGRMQDETQLVQTKFVSAYFLGRIGTKLQSQMFNSSPIRSPLKTDLSHILSAVSQDGSQEFMRQDVSQLSFLQSPVSKQPSSNQSDYYVKAYLLYKSREGDFTTCQTFQFQLLLQKLEKKLSKLGIDINSLTYEPNLNNFFSINSIRQSQIHHNQVPVLQMSQIRMPRPAISEIRLIDVNHITIKTMLRRGNDCQLYSGILNLDDQKLPCLVKMFPGLNYKYCQTIHAELNRWSAIKGLNQIYGVAIELQVGDHYQLYIASEAQQANLLQICSLNRTFEQRTIFMNDLIAVVKEMHDKDLVHGNLKPQNVLVLIKDGSMQVLLSDYGWPTILYQDLLDTDHRDHAYGYSSPESIDQGGGQGKESDIWSLGVLILQIFSEYPLNQDTLIKLDIFNKDPKKRNWSHLEQAGLQRISALLNRMLVYDHRKRATINQVWKLVNEWK